MNMKDKHSPIYLKYILTAFLLLSFTNIAEANNIKVLNTTILPQDSTDLANKRLKIKFHIEWENSWRDSYSQIFDPDVNGVKGRGNFDAAWVFVKFSIDGGRTWNHARLYSPTTPNTNGIVGSAEGYSTGTGTSIEIKVPPDNAAGAFIERSTGPSSGKLSVDDVVLVWNYGNPILSKNGTGLSSITDGQANMAVIRVMAIEMVYIPEGKFNVGSGLPSNSSSDKADMEFKSFYTCNNTSNTYQIINDDKICIGGLTSTNTCLRSGATNPKICWASSTSNDGSNPNIAIQSEFPKGFKAFYVMKYELSQGQYRDFYNMLTYDQQASHAHSSAYNNPTTGVYAMTNSSALVNRNGLRFFATEFDKESLAIGSDLSSLSNEYNSSDDGEWVAMNFLLWQDLAAYAEWSGLRPWSELEFEKAARGVAPPVTGEFAWGLNGPDTYVNTNTTMSYIKNTTGLYNDGSADETDSINQSISQSMGIANFTIAWKVGSVTTTYSLGGPARVGYASAIDPTKVGQPSSETINKTHAGSSYYGVMELSGNVEEMVAAISTAADTSLTFDGSHGNGELESDGFAYEPKWPGRATTATNLNKVNSEDGTGTRGGGWNSKLDATNQAVRISSRLDIGPVGGTRSTSINDQGGRLARSAP